MRSRPRGVRELTREEVELWRVVTANVQPRSPQKRAIAKTMRQVERNSALEHRPAPAPAPAVEHRRKPLGVIERKTQRDLRKGKLSIDVRLDLHGLRLADAHTRVLSFLARAQSEGARIALIVTGKGKIGTDGMEGGPLKRQAPLWLADPKLRHVVAAFGEASPEHGGGGALYVRLRRIGRP